jgi:Hint domain
MSELASLDGREAFWTAEPRQDVALSCPAFEILYGGQKGGMKSETLLVKPSHMLDRAHEIFMETGVKQARCRIVIFRKNIKHLNDLITRAKELYPKLDPEAGPGGWNKNEKRFTFTSGACVEFDHLDGPDDHQGYNGQELRGICIDQCEEISFEVVQFLKAQVRTSDPRYSEFLFCFLTANPGGKHSDWVKTYFIKSCPPNTVVSTDVKLRDGRVKTTTRALIPSALKDNPYLNNDGNYEANLRTLPEHMQRMYLDGDWDAVVGAYFAHVWRKDIHVIQSFPVSDAWEIKMGLDWGSTAPACALWGTRDQDGVVYIIDEQYGPGITGRTWGEKLKDKFIRQQWGNKKRSVDEVYGLIDYHAFSKQGADGMSPGQGLMSCGFRLFDALKDRGAGNEQVLERLLLQTSGKPRIYIFGDRCPNLVRTLPSLRGDPNKPDDVDSDQEDHCFIAGTSILTTTGPKPIEQVRVGDLIVTDDGPRPALLSGCSAPEVNVMRVDFDDGTSLTGTPGHGIYLADGAKVRLDALKYSDIVSTCDPRLSFGMESSSVGTLTQRIAPIASTTAPARSMFGTVSATSTGKSGGLFTDLFRRASTFITQITTLPTTTLATSFACQGSGTFQSTAKNSSTFEPRSTLNTWQRSGSMQPSGTEAKKESPGTVTMAVELGRRGSHSKFHAPSAGSDSETSRAVSVITFALPTAEPGGESSRALITEIGSAPYAESHSTSTDTSRNGPALKRVRAVYSAGRAAVYNLTVADRHRYYADGVLVSNCYDALKYLLLDWPIGSEDKRHSQDVEVERWLRLAKQKQRQRDADNSYIQSGYGS